MTNLYIAVGVPGSGKSTKIHELMEEKKDEGRSIYISRDEIRFSLLNDSDKYFAKETKVFQEFAKQIFCAIISASQYANIFVDATHISVNSREKLKQNIPNFYSKKIRRIALVMKVDPDICVERNSSREGRAFVPETAIRNMAESFEMPTFEEGFDEILIYETTKEDNV